ncbi:MAG: signal recognition particle-docking protein FtsY [Candidatus Methanomethylophilus sp.]|nr:signal recognition particle-docking protein FtsY [Methanomethylophilus sp.]
MFDSLKSKLKNLFKKGEKLDAESVYKEEPEAPVVQETAAPEVPETETPVQETVPEQVPEPKREEPAPEVKPEPTPTPAPKKEEKKEDRKSKPVKGKNKRSDEMLSSSFLSKKIKDDPLDDILDELEVTLLESDVAYPVVQEIIVGVRNNLAGKKYSREYTLEEIVELAVKEAVSDVLRINVFDFDAWLAEQKKPTVIMFIGINGTGKTTAIAKIANRLKQEGRSVVLAACDTFRAGAIEQLSIHADKLNVKIVKSVQDADPASVAYDAIEHARSKMKDVVLIDTAGRMQTNNNLIAEMKKIVKVAKPDLKIFVGDSLAGNDAVEQAKVFDEAVGIDAIILTKIDTDAKGGAALSIAKTIGKPIAFVCDGQEYEDIEKFDADWMLERLFDQVTA